MTQDLLPPLNNPSSLALSLLKSSFNALTAQIAVIDESGRILFTNDAWMKFSNFHKNGKECTRVSENYRTACKKEAFTGDPYAQKILNGFDLIEKGKKKEFILEYPRFERCIQLRLTKFTETGGVFYVIAYQDITDHIASENTMDLIRKQTESILKNAGEGIFGLNVRGEVTFINPEALKLLGYKEKDLVGKKLHTICHNRRVDGTPYPETDCPVYRALHKGITSRGDNEAYIRRNGSFLLISFTITPIWEDEKIQGAVVTFQDTKERLEKERMLVKNEAVLRLLNVELSRSNTDLQDFASVASHDLQEPLRKIQAFSDRLKLKSAASLNDEGIDYLDRIQHAAERMQILINDLLTYSRVTTKAQPFRKINPDEILSETLTDLEIRITETRAVIHRTVLPEIEADPLQMRQLFQNLIGNALKFKKASVPPEVRINGEIVSKKYQGKKIAFLKLVISDNGIGFDEKYSEKIFHVFQRLHGVKEYSGTGIGLAVCKKIVERHNGRIDVKSSPGVGTSFTVYLPMAQGGEPKWQQT